MGVDPVEDHPQTQSVGSPAEQTEVLLRAQHGVRGLIVAGVVAVAGKAFADGVQIQDRGPQRSDVGKLFRNSGKIPAVKIVVENGAVLLRLPENLFVPVLVDSIRGELTGEVGTACFAEPVGEYLINNGALRPVGGGEALRHAADLPQVPRLHIGVVPLLEQAEGAGIVVDNKIVEAEPRLLQGEFPPEAVIGPLPGLVIQRKVKAGGAVLPGYVAVHTISLHRYRHPHPQGADLPRRQHPKRGLVFGQLAVIKDPHKK